MPYVEAATLADIPRKDRPRFQRLLYNKAVLSYAFSYDKLHKLASQLTDDEEEIREMIDACVEGHSSKEIETAKNLINEAVLAIMGQNGIKTLDATDPFGREKSFIYTENKGIPRFKPDRAIEVCSKYKVSPDTMIKIIEDATVRTPFVTLQCRDKSSNSKDEDEE